MEKEKQIEICENCKVKNNCNHRVLIQKDGCSVNDCDYYSEVSPKEKQIVEIVKETIYQNATSVVDDIDKQNNTHHYMLYDEDIFYIAKRVKEKLTEDSVVLSREEYETLKNQINSLRTELSKAVCSMYTEEEFEYKVDQKVKEELDRVKKEARKETAEKILEKGKYCMPSGLREWIIEQFGVEIKE